MPRRARAAAVAAVLGALLPRSATAQCTITTIAQPANSQPLPASCAANQILADGSTGCHIACELGYSVVGAQPSCSGSTFDDGGVTCASAPPAPSACVPGIFLLTAR